MTAKLNGRVLNALNQGTKQTQNASANQIVNQIKNAGQLPSATSPSKRQGSWQYKADGTRKTFDELSTPEVLTWIGTLPETERAGAAKQFETDYLKNPGSTRYDPYYTDYSNNDEARRLFGVNTFDREWIDNNRGYYNYLTFSGENYTSPKKPGKYASAEEQAAYQYWQIANTYEATTQSAEAEYARLRQEIAEKVDLIRKAGDTPDTDEILAGIDWSEYKTLENLREASAAGNARILNRPVQVGDASLRSMVNAAIRGEDVSKNRDFIWAESEYLSRPQSTAQRAMTTGFENALGGNKKTVDDRTNVTSAEYDPYYADISNNEAARELFGVNTFDQEWIDANRDLMQYVAFADEDDVKPVKPGKNATDDEKKAYQYWLIANTYEQTTSEGEKELEELRAWMQRRADRLGNKATADDLIGAIDWDEYPTLQEMREVSAAGNARMLNRPVKAGDESIRAMADQILGSNENTGNQEETEIYGPFLTDEPIKMPEMSSTATATPSATPTATPSATPTATPSATPTATPSEKPSVNKFLLNLGRSQIRALGQALQEMDESDPERDEIAAKIEELEDIESIVAPENARTANELAGYYVAYKMAIQREEDIYGSSRVEERQTEYNEYVGSLRAEFGLNQAIFLVESRVGMLEEFAQTEEDQQLAEELKEQLYLLKNEAGERESIAHETRAALENQGMTGGGVLEWLWNQNYLDALNDGDKVPMEDFEKYMRYRLTPGETHYSDMAKYDQMGRIEATLGGATMAVQRGVSAINIPFRAVEEVLYWVKSKMHGDMTREELYASDKDLNALRAWNATFENTGADASKVQQFAEQYPGVKFITDGLGEILKMGVQSDMAAMIAGSLGGLKFARNLVASGSESSGWVKAFGLQSLPFSLDAFASGVQTARDQGADDDQAFLAGSLTGALVGPMSSFVSDQLQGLGKKLFASRAGRAAAEQGAAAAAKNGWGNAIWSLVKSGLWEGFEEAIEEPTEGLIAKSVYDRERAWLGEGGVVDPMAMLESGAMGAVVGPAFSLMSGISGRLGDPIRTKAEDMARRLTNGEEVSEEEFNELESMAAREAAVQDRTEEIETQAAPEMEAAAEKAKTAADNAQTARRASEQATRQLAEERKANQPVLDAFNDGTASYDDPEAVEQLKERSAATKKAQEASDKARQAYSEAQENAQKAADEAEETIARIHNEARAEAEAEVNQELQAEREAEAQALADAEKQEADRPDKPGVRMMTQDRVQLTREQKTQLDILNELGKRYGLEIDVVDTLKGANAMYEGGRRITVALDAAESAYVQAGVHEMVHYVRNYSEGAYNIVEGVVLGYLEEAGFDLEEEIAKRISEYEGTQQLTREEAMEEIIAEAVPTVFTNEESMRELVGRDRTLVEKIRDFFVEFARTLNNIAMQYVDRNGRTEIAYLSDNVEALMDIADVLDQALEYAGGKTEKEMRTETAAQAEPETVVDAEPETVAEAEPETAAKTGAETETRIDVAGEPETVAEAEPETAAETGAETEARSPESKTEAVNQQPSGENQGRRKERTINQIEKDRWIEKNVMLDGDGKPKLMYVYEREGDEELAQQVTRREKRLLRYTDDLQTVTREDKNTSPQVYYIRNNDVEGPGITPISKKTAKNYIEQAIRFELYGNRMQRKAQLLATKVTLNGLVDKLYTGDLYGTAQKFAERFYSGERDDRTVDDAIFNMTFRYPSVYILESGPVLVGRGALISPTEYVGDDGESGEAKEEKRQTRYSLNMGADAGSTVEEVRTQEREQLKNSAERIAKLTLREYKSTMLLSEATTEIDQMITAYQEHDDQKAQQVAERLGQKIVMSSEKTDVSHREGYEETRKRLRETGFGLTQTQRQEVASQYGSVNDWRKSVMGSVKLKNDAASLDSIWGELSEMHPEYFPADAAEGEMPGYISTFVQAMRPKHVNPYGFDTAGAAADLSMQLQADVMEMMGGDRKEQAEKLRDESDALRQRTADQREAKTASRRERRQKEFAAIAEEMRAAREKGDSASIQELLNRYRRLRGGKSKAADAVEAGMIAKNYLTEARRLDRMIGDLDNQINGEDTDEDRAKLVKQREQYEVMRDEFRRTATRLHRQQVIDRVGMDAEAEADAWDEEAIAEMQREMDEDMSEMIDVYVAEMRERVDKMWAREKETQKDFNVTSTIGEKGLCAAFADVEGEIIQHSELYKTWQKRRDAAREQLYSEKNRVLSVRAQLKNARNNGNVYLERSLMIELQEAEDRTHVLSSQVKQAEAQEAYHKRMGAESLSQALNEGKLPQPIMERVIAMVKDSGRKGLLNGTAIAEMVESERLTMTTAARVWDDIFGVAAPLMRAIYYDKVMENESARQKWIAGWRERLGALKLTEAESHDVQAIGEGRGEPTIALEPSEKVINAIREYRAFYEEAHALAKRALVRNGYPAPGYISDYFPHLDIPRTFLEKLGIPVEHAALPTSINGMTESFKPGKQYSSHLLTRKGETTDLDAMYGFEEYVGAISGVIFHTDDIQRHRQLESEIRAASEKDPSWPDHNVHGASFFANHFVNWLSEYTNLLAGKKSAIDRGAEKVLVGRVVYKLGAQLKSLKGASAVGGNIASAITNFVPVTQIMGEHPIATLKGNALALMETVNGRGNRPESQYLIRRFGSDSINQTLYSRISKIAGKPFELIDALASNMIVNAYYQANLDMGMDSETAMRSADAKAARLMGDRSTGAMPNAYGSQIVGFLTQFQYEVANQSQHFRKDLWRQKGLGKGLFVLFMTSVWASIWNELTEKILGRRTAADPINMAVELYTTASKGDGWLPIVQSTYNNVSEIFPYLGQGRIAATEGIVDFMLSLFQEGSDWGDVGYAAKDAVIGMIPFAGQAKKSVRGYWAAKRGGYYNASGDQLRYAVDNENPLVWVQAIVFGPSSLQTAQDYYSGDAPGLTAPQTRNYEQAKERGYTEVEAYRNEADKAAAEKLDSEADKQIKTNAKEMQANEVGHSYGKQADISRVEEQREEAAALRGETMPGEQLTDYWWERKDEPGVQAAVEYWRQTGETWALPKGYSWETEYTIKGKPRSLGDELAAEADRMYEEGYAEIMYGVDLNQMDEEEREEIKKELEALKRKVDSYNKERIVEGRGEEVAW